MDTRTAYPSVNGKSRHGINLEKVKELRLDRKLSRHHAARLAGWNGEFAAQFWADIEHGRRNDMRVSTLRGIARALGVQIQELML